MQQLTASRRGSGPTSRSSRWVGSSGDGMRRCKSNGSRSSRGTASSASQAYLRRHHPADVNWRHHLEDISETSTERSPGRCELEPTRDGCTCWLCGAIGPRARRSSAHAQHAEARVCSISTICNSRIFSMTCIFASLGVDSPHTVASMIQTAVPAAAKGTRHK